MLPGVPGGINALASNTSGCALLLRVSVVVVTVTPLLAPQAISLRIATVRGQRVILDSDLAALYEVETKRFNEAVRRNLIKFPTDFMFQLSADEWAALRSQFATLDAAPGGRGRHRKYLPYAFTEHGDPRLTFSSIPWES
jgi:hypothetical protein